MEAYDERRAEDASDIEPVSGQSIEEAEKNLSRHATKDSSPPVDEQWRTTVTPDAEGEARGGQANHAKQGGE